jgi:arylsulfatase A-like enzyme
MTARANRLVVVAVALAAIVAGMRVIWAKVAPQADPNHVDTPDLNDINIVFILVDTLRADHLNCYGYERQTSPVIDALASSGVRFAQVRSQASWTKNSMASLWTAEYPARTGVLRFQHALPEAVTMPAEILEKAGFFTAGIWRNGWISSKFGFAQGFDVYYQPAPSSGPEQMARRNPSLHPLLGTDVDITASAREFLRTYAETRFFLYLHYMDVHQYVYDDESALFGVDYLDAYDNAIRWVDGNIGALVEALAERDLLEKTLIVLASDHGEAFLEHGYEGHARDVYREVTETPLIMRLPRLIPVGQVIEPLVQNIDIWPTILDLLDLPPLDSAQGTSLLPLVEATNGIKTPATKAISRRPTFAHMDRTWARRNVEPRPLVSVTDGRYRLIRPLTPPGEDELYDRVNDPTEQTNLASSQPERVERLGKLIEEYIKSAPATLVGAEDVDIDEVTLERLRALGYLQDNDARP